MPLVLLQHFRGGLDNWDPLVTNGLAQGCSVILFNNAGVASSSGETPNTIDAMGDHLATFVNALGLPHVDVLGFSIGGYVAQSFVLRHPHLVRRLVLAGTGPRNGEPRKNPRVSEVAGNPVPRCEDFLFLVFSPSEASQAAGRAFWERRHQRKDADPPSLIQTMKAQQAALMEWGQPRGERYADLKTIKQPTLVVNGNDDIIDTHNQLVHAFAAHSERTTDCVSGLRSWRALPVPRALRGAHETLPRISTNTNDQGELPSGEMYDRDQI
jgi:pimeloyl-ACP methyl ester carboxylesterase